MGSSYLDLSFKPASTLAAQRIVAHNGTANTVAYPSGSTVLPLGITLDTVKDTNEGIPVRVAGIAKLFFNDTVTSGSPVASDTSGRGIPLSLGDTTAELTMTAAIVGILLDANVNATGTIANVLVVPQYVR